jgi:DNA ligase-1
MLAMHVENTPQFKECVELAVNPYVTFGMAQLPEPDYSDDPDSRKQQFDEATWVLLSQLASRRLSGLAAKSAVAGELGSLSEASADLLRRILTKDLRAGFGATLANKVKPGWVPVFDCMLAYPFDPKRVKNWPVGVEPKLDGFRVLAFIDCEARSVRMLSRSGKEYSSFKHLEPRLLDLASIIRPEYSNESLIVFDGEVVSGTFNETASRVRKKDVACTDAIYHVFEILPGSVFRNGKSSREYEYRRQSLGILPATTPVRRVSRLLAYSEEGIHALYTQYREQGLEGVIVKALDGRYELKRSYAWMKMKAEETLDLTVVDAFEGTGKYEGKLGGLTVLHEGLRVNVGSGFSDQQREEFWELYDEDMQRRQECGVRGEDAVDTLLGAVAEVQYHEVTPDGSLRHPRFVRFRGSVSEGKE